MQPWLRGLAELLDGWSGGGGPIQITESETAILVHAMPPSEASKLAETLRQGGWTFKLEDRGENQIEVKDLLEEYAPFRLTAEKPSDVAGPGRRVTNTAFTTLLRQTPPTGTFLLARCETAFETMVFRIAPFVDTTPFTPKAIDAKPRRVVRESGGTRVAPEDIGPWLLRGCETVPWADTAFQAWACLARSNLARCLANDIEGDTLVFRGPPLVRLAISRNRSAAGNEAGFLATQKAAAWVYDNERELEMRHGLLASEIARAAPVDDDAILAIERLAGPALESARIAYGLNISQISRDSLRALADLRKAVSDETAKLADTTRGIATSVATAVFAGLGVVLARLTSGTPSLALIGLACVPIAYVVAVILSGCKFLKVLRRIRSQWRQRLYVFLPESDYEQMVEGPARDAEAAFRIASWSGFLISVVVFAGVVWFVWQADRGPQTTPGPALAPKETTQRITPPIPPAALDTPNPALQPPASPSLAPNKP